MNTTVKTDEDEDKDDYYCHEVMMMRRRWWRRKTTTRTDDSMDYCCEEEKEDNEEKDMDVCMVPIGQYIIHLHPTQHGMMTFDITTVTTTIRTNCLNQIQIRNRIEGKNRKEQPSKTRTKGGREKEKKYIIHRT